MSAIPGQRELPDILQQVQSIQWNLLHDCRLLLRGAVAFGPLCHTQTACFGPALVEAYDRCKGEMAPRVLICDPLLQALQHQHGERVGQVGLISQDRDGAWYVDYLDRLVAMSRGDRSMVGGVMPGILREFRPRIVDGYQSAKANERAHAKWAWIIEHFNRKLSEYAIDGVDPIPPT